MTDETEKIIDKLAEAYRIVSLKGYRPYEFRLTAEDQTTLVKEIYDMVDAGSRAGKFLYLSYMGKEVSEGWIDPMIFYVPVRYIEDRSYLEAILIGPPIITWPQLPPMIKIYLEDARVD